jgi:hypothetical protein
MALPCGPYSENRAAQPTILSGQASYQVSYIGRRSHRAVESLTHLPHEHMVILLKVFL